jgi:hypothetical protein
MNAGLCSLIFNTLASAQSVVPAITLPTLLSSYPQLSQLHAAVTNSSTLSALFNQADNFTLLAPTDSAILTWLSSSTPDVSQPLEAVLSYHMLSGRHATASIANASLAIPSALTNELYANVTSGQRVVTSNNGVVEFESGAKATSKIITGVRNEGNFPIPEVPVWAEDEVGYTKYQWIHPYRRRRARNSLYLRGYSLQGES